MCEQDPYPSTQDKEMYLVELFQASLLSYRTKHGPQTYIIAPSCHRNHGLTPNSSLGAIMFVIGFESGAQLPIIASLTLKHLNFNNQNTKALKHQLELHVCIYLDLIPLYRLFARKQYCTSNNESQNPNFTNILTPEVSAYSQCLSKCIHCRLKLMEG